MENLEGAGRRQDPGWKEDRVWEGGTNWGGDWFVMGEETGKRGRVFGWLRGAMACVLALASSSLFGGSRRGDGGIGTSGARGGGFREVR